MNSCAEHLLGLTIDPFHLTQVALLGPPLSLSSQALTIISFMAGRESRICKLRQPHHMILHTDIRKVMEALG
jgi:hypothetical protein